MRRRDRIINPGCCPHGCECYVSEDDNILMNIGHTQATAHTKGYLALPVEHDIVQSLFNLAQFLVFCSSSFCVSLSLYLSVHVGLVSNVSALTWVRRRVQMSKCDVTCGRLLVMMIRQLLLLSYPDIRAHVLPSLRYGHTGVSKLMNTSS